MHLNPDTQLTDFLGKNHFFCNEHCRSRPSDYKVAVTICVIYQLKMVDFVSSYSLRLRKTVLKTFKIISIDIRGVNEVQRDRKDCLSSHYEAHYNSEELWRFRRNEGKKRRFVQQAAAEPGRTETGVTKTQTEQRSCSLSTCLPSPSLPSPSLCDVSHPTHSLCYLFMSTSLTHISVMQLFLKTFH